MRRVQKRRNRVLLARTENTGAWAIGFRRDSLDRWNRAQREQLVVPSMAPTWKLIKSRCDRSRLHWIDDRVGKQTIVDDGR